MATTHEYRALLTWEGNRGEGTATHASYGREYRIAIGGKPMLRGSAHPAFRGDAAMHDPEDLFLGAISSCHMLSYLALCAREHVRVVAYEDDARGTLSLSGDGGRFAQVTLRPVVTVAHADDVERAFVLHERAHELCYIASSCSVPIEHFARVVVA